MRTFTLLSHQAIVLTTVITGKIAGFAVDVVYMEPIRPDNPLLQAKNCIITPHISWAPKESRQRIMDCTVENIRAFLEQKPIHIVNG